MKQREGGNYYTIQLRFDNALLTKSSEVHTEARQPLRAIGRHEEVSFEFRAKDSLTKRVADMSR